MRHTRTTPHPTRTTRGTLRTRLAAAVLALLGSTALVACGDDSEPVAAVPDGADHNSADVRFATEMIPHHAQALHMVDMAEGRDLTPEAEQLMSDIEAAQTPEIEQMSRWLEEWDQPVPDTSGMGPMGGDMDMDHMGDMVGAMSEEALAELEGAEGTVFERMWLQMMIEHHEGAIEMAEVELDEGEHAGTLDLAESIIESQRAEIELMESMLER
ncbi:DUF305 domain-containing protein [uncultured Nocardioides sp.]|uniref:DUF305 domain-containing protein n=1 Tax=uncultured Nocardioides sp. TaxID=198441 RepID=UPI000C4DAEC9|nr:DUF305 domain-containing protein [Nocardioides sp.]